MASSGTLNTFGAVFTFAIDLETRLSAYYSDIGDSVMASAADKRRKKLERVRRENVVEITLEPITGLDADDYALDLSDSSENGQASAARIACVSSTVTRRRRSMCARLNGR